jgi:hypothetical protein
MCAGEDAIFAQNMAEKFRRGEDWNISVPHRVPETWKGFWGTRSEKGRGVPQRRVWIEGWSSSSIVLDSLKWLAKSLGWLLLIWPWVNKARMLSRALPGNRHPLSRLIVPVLFDRIAHEIGRWEGVAMVLKRDYPGKIQQRRL